MTSKRDTLAEKNRKLPYAPGVSLKMAKIMLDAGIKEAEKRSTSAAIAVADSGGNLLAFNRMDNAILCSIQIAMDKAYTAVFGKWPTDNWANLCRSGSLVPLYLHERWMTAPGGFPLVNGEAIVGGIGVSGATSQDLYIARAVIQKGGFSLEEVDVAIEEIEAVKKK